MRRPTLLLLPRTFDNRTAQYGGSELIFSETSFLYDTYQNEIWKMLWEGTKDFGNEHVLDFISSFNGANDVGCELTFKNLLIWYAIERLANQIVKI